MLSHLQHRLAAYRLGACRRLFIATLAAVCVLGGALGVLPAQAQNSNTADLPGTPLRDAFVKAFNELITPLLDGQCFDMKFAGRVPVAFVGIPRNTIHLSNLQRDSLNQLARKALNNPFLNVQDTAALSAIASYSGNNELDRQRLREAVAKVRNAPLVLVISAERPARKLARLQLQLFTTRKGGARACPKSATLLVDLERLVAIPRTLAERYEPFDSGFVQHRFAFREGIRRMARELPDYTAVNMVARLNLSGNCALSQQALSNLQGIFSSVGDDQAASFALDVSDWPRLLSAVELQGSKKPKPPTESSDPSQRIAMLEVDVALNTAYPNAYFMTMRLVGPQRIRKVVNFGVLTGPRLTRGCRPRATDFLGQVLEDARRKPASFTIEPIKPVFQVGVDEVDFIIKPRKTAYFYCWIMDQEGTAYVLLPWRKEMLGETWKAGETYNYPSDFVRGSRRSKFDELPGLNIYQQVATEMFGCFATPDRADEALEADWIKAHPANKGGEGEARSLSRAQVTAFMERWRQLPGAQENYTLVRAVP